MRLLVIAKYPPIEGGVSSEVYRATHELAQAGHEVHVVTNANEVEENFREQLLWEDPSWGSNMPGMLRVWHTGPIGRARFLPQSNAYESKLYGLAIQIAVAQRCELVVGWYVQPYGFVASMIARSLKLPLIQAHAGSDIFRIAKHSDLSHTIKDSLQSANFVLTFRKQVVIERLVELGIRQDRLVYLSGSRLPPWFDDSVTSPVQKRSAELRWKEPPTILHYSKIHDSKGTFDLVASLGRLASAGLPFRFKILRLGWPEELNRLSIMLDQYPELKSRTLLIDPVAPWQIPALLCSVDVIPVLERAFKIPSHSPKLIREVLWAGRCLVASQEVADKSSIGHNLVNGKTVLLVKDPTDSNELDLVLHTAFTNAALVQNVSRQGKMMSEVLEGFSEPVGPYARAIDQHGPQLLGLSCLNASGRL